MPVKRALLLLVVCASVALAVDPPELRPLKGEKIKGDLVGLNDKEIVLQVNGKPVATPVEGTLQLDFRAPATPLGTYSQVELTDGSILRCSKVEFKGKDAILTLVSGQVATVPMTLLGSIMHEANDVKLVAAWKELLGTNKRPATCSVRKKDAGSLGYFEGTFYDASDDGKTIEFKVKDKDAKTAIRRSRRSTASSSAASPTRTCRAGCARCSTPRGPSCSPRAPPSRTASCVVETQCGAKVAFQPRGPRSAGLQQGKLTFLSDIDLAQRVKLVQVARQGRTPEFRRDRNPDNTGRYPRGRARSTTRDW